ncbi:4-(cytidine 5'-diphospho)-2-C-methyl-D-erythritol kinase [Salinarimonas rosea]|uniref:4-(cytidine 5'-diphospho)-2-C-methyl-D-erythritol kinase n=1 Tax=Salinarimonas rosea TaxID=552063 RepID=UPI0004160A09|nr:4-(cytidine 5'-diphospho)-2-C-methyl-D-erythritol kinase [Salinarimonas rosea]
MPEALTAFAAAKVNLTLAVLGRREDGYHRLSSLVAFADVGDDLALVPGGDTAVAVEGPQATALAGDPDNLVVKAARALAERVPGLMSGRFRLTKRLPVASGIGGGSADAAAALRLLARANGLPLDDPRVTDAAAGTGADVPVCLAGRVCVMEGIGERLGPALPCPVLPAVLVNPGVPVETRAVFRALGLSAGETRAVAPTALGFEPGVSGADLVARLRAAGNDLEAPAIAVAPVVADVIGAVRETPGCALARMSGSGATVFGLYGSDAQAGAAAARLAAAHPGWWVAATRLGPAQDCGATVRNAPTSAPSTASP